jgi:large subunit ribosomal protein L32
MALPKRRHSRTRRDKRRANWKLAPPSINKCPHCGTARRPHRICPKPDCGYYRDEKVLGA